jgi:hypothetical protein
MDISIIDQLTRLFRPLTPEEQEKAKALYPVVLDSLRQEAAKVNKNLDDMLKNGEILENVLTSVVVDVISRNLLTSTEAEPMTQISQSAMGYSFSGTYLNPGGGLFIKKSELARLGLKKQKFGAIDLYA